MPAKKRVKKPRTAKERRERVDKILGHLDEMFPDVTCALKHRGAWQLLVATILSAQCTDERVNKVTPGLFKKYPTVKDFAAVSQEELAEDIRSTGFFNNKAKSVRGAAQKLIADYKGRVPKTMDEMLEIPGVARKTANVVLGTAYGIATGIVVDTHVTRLSHRLDLSQQKDAVKIEKDLVKIVPEERWIQFSHQIIHHGRGLCNARKPNCTECPMESLCYAKDKVA